MCHAGMNKPLRYKVGNQGDRGVHTASWQWHPGEQPVHVGTEIGMASWKYYGGAGDSGQSAL